MQNKKKRIVSIVALAMAATLTLTSCGGGGTKTTPTTSPKATGTPTASATPNVSAEPTAAPTSFKQSPMLDEMKDLPAVKDRLPENPKIASELLKEDLNYEIGTYGGTMRTVTSALDWDADVFIMNVEPLVNSPSITGQEITPNVVESYETSEDSKTFTFKLRKGLKWSDGTAVTIEDVRFAWEDVIMNKELNPVVPAWLCAGAKVGGEPLAFKIIDDYTFSLTSAEAYGGFLLQLSLSSWRGYQDLLKPSAYLKKFHKDMPEFDKAASDKIAEARNISDDKNRWISVFGIADITNWDLTKKEAIGFPSLHPWTLTNVDNSGQIYTYERNPYYFKVDTDGNQLPYLDKIQSTQVADMEMVTMKMLAGEVDLARESCTLANISMYKENEKNGYQTLLTNSHVNPAGVWLNMTYEDETWREVTQNKEFRRALSYAIDRDEIIDAVYYGYATAADSLIDSEFNVDKANKILDEIGMDKRDKDGKRLAPNGKPFEILIETGAETADFVPVGELVVEMWNNVGVKTSMKRIEQSLVANKRNANEIQGTMGGDSFPTWYYQDFGLYHWGKTWETWKTKATTATITKEDGTVEEIKVVGEEPPAEVKEYYKCIDDLMIVSQKDSKEALDKLKANLRENVWYFPTVENAKQPVIVNKKMGNISETCMGVALDYAGEQLYYKN